MTPQLLVVRHFPTIKECLCIKGRKDNPDINPNQPEILALLKQEIISLKGQNVVIFTSPSKRTRQTAELIQKIIGNGIIFDESRLYEQGYASLEGGAKERSKQFSGNNAPPDLSLKGASVLIKSKFGKCKEFYVFESEYKRLQGLLSKQKKIREPEIKIDLAPVEIYGLDFSVERFDRDQVVVKKLIDRLEQGKELSNVQEIIFNPVNFVYKGESNNQVDQRVEPLMKEAELLMQKGINVIFVGHYGSNSAVLRATKKPFDSPCHGKAVIFSLNDLKQR